jgi:hypothetical protein
MFSQRITRRRAKILPDSAGMAAFTCWLDASSLVTVSSTPEELHVPPPGVAPFHDMHDSLRHRGLVTLVVEPKAAAGLVRLNRESLRRGRIHSGRRPDRVGHAILVGVCVGGSVPAVFGASEVPDASAALSADIIL